MALAYNVKQKLKLGNALAALVAITMDNAYAAGGVALDAAKCGIGPGPIGFVVPVGAVEGAGAGATLSWDDTNAKLKIYESAGAGALPTEIGAADLNNAILNVLVVGASPTG